MADDSQQQIRGIQWRETFPFTHLFRAFRIAIHPSKLILGLVALLSLYAGGRILDGLWSVRHLAVPGEVSLYEQVVREGGTSESFVRARRAARDTIENNYADRLLAIGAVKDHDAALAAARDADKLPAVKANILAERTRLVDDAMTVKNQAYTAAEKLSGSARDAAHAAADDAFRTSVRAAYDQATENLVDAKLVKGVGLFHAFFTYEAESIVSVVRGAASWNWFSRGDGRPGVVPSVISFFTVGPVWLMRHHPLYFILFALLFLTVWGIFGGAIARIAAIHVARDEKLSVRAALAFSIGKFLSFVSAPVIPLLIVLIVGLLPLIAGALASIPYVGPVINILMGLLFVFILAAGFVMTLVLLGTFGGFNLMYPTIAVEGSDSFDAISRSFSYVYAKPWRMLFYTLVAIVYGALCYLFVRLFIWLMLMMTHQFVGAGMWADAPSTYGLWETMWRGPAVAPGRLSYDIDFLTLRRDQDVAASLVAFWVYLVIGMLGAFAISFYFTSNTIIYYLMRREVDATEMDDVFLEQSDEEFGEIPGSGGAAGEPAMAGAAVPAGAVPAAATTETSMPQARSVPQAPLPTTSTESSPETAAPDSSSAAPDQPEPPPT